MTIPDKANRILKLILVALVLVAGRLWHLGVYQHDDQLQQARRAGKRVEVENALRATLRDRFNIPLAQNRLRYQAAVVYSQIRTLPSVQWQTGPNGKKIKVFKRKEYIHTLSQFLAEELGLDPLRIEDEIHAKASLYNNIPFILKEEISEDAYSRLKARMKDWPGLLVKRSWKRHYPKGPLASDVIGYLGAINKKEYDAIIQEREELKMFLDGLELGADLPMPEPYHSLSQVKNRLKDLEELAYTVYDSVGKSGIEARFEQELRGFQGKRVYFSDSKGHLLRECPGKKQPAEGRRLLLSLSEELQEEAEKLLVLCEDMRDTRVKIGDTPTKVADKAPWIKGGAIIAMDPNTGEILAMASYPRFDPNDFILTGSPETQQEKKLKIHNWLEDEESCQNIYNGISPLLRDRVNFETGAIYQEEKKLDWQMFCELTLAKDSEIKNRLQEIGTTEKGLRLLKNPSKSESLQTLDFLRLQLDEALFTPPLIKAVGSESLESRFKTAQAWAEVKGALKELAKTLFHEIEFSAWRLKEEKAFIAAKREEEKKGKKYPKPYIDYLDEEERELFRAFWQTHLYDLALILLKGNQEPAPYAAELLVFREELLKGAHKELKWNESFQVLEKRLKPLATPLAKEYLVSLRNYEDLTRPLLGSWKLLKKGKTEKNLARSFYPVYGFGFGRTYAYRQAATMGSIFKLLTGYTALMQAYQKNKRALLDFNIYDHVFKSQQHTYVGYFADGKPIPQLYKGGRIPRSAHTHLGQMDLLSAFENSSNPYFALLASDVIEKPEDLAETAKLFFGRKTGIDLPGEIKGRVPADLATNRTGLYATAIGQHTLVVTPLQAAVMLASFANGGKILKPQIISLKAGKKRERILEEIPPLDDFPHKTALNSLGIDFPIFTHLINPQSLPLVSKTTPEILNEIALPEKIRNLLLEGMRRVVQKTYHDSLFSLSRIYHDAPDLISDYVEMKDYMVGKTSTAESIEHLSLDRPDEHSLYTHVWFGGISFEEEVAKERFKKPELVVIVYLRYGGFGKEAAPLAARIVKKWRTIKKKNGISN